MAAVAIVGLACRYPEARSPVELWENVLAQRRAFRQLPADRLRVQDYYSVDHRVPDHTYSTQAAVIADHKFDRVRFRISGRSFRSADLAHWLALEVASDALADAGFPDGVNLPSDMTGVVLGNTLTGEFSRAAGLRLRWPYVRRVLDLALSKEGWSADRRRPFLEQVEEVYKRPFPPVTEETLAGGLSNTIAGRICNHFNLKGGGYTVDAACAASLLAVTTACSALATGDLDVAIAGGVDLSLDPFELVGFAKAGALARNEMLVYDARSEGFWPGEGCGFVVLMRHDDARAQGRRIYAVIRGWGVSSDGSGGITRPEVEGQLLALRRAYHRAGFGIETVALFEGHGTGTAVGDATELRSLIRARQETGTHAPVAALGSIKANIGHTKAAAGVAGLIKTAMALQRQVLPPTTGCLQPHPELTHDGCPLKVLDEGQLWPSDQPLRAGVSAMGFGGINTHVVLESGTSNRCRQLGARERICLHSVQDAELMLLAGRDEGELLRLVDRLSEFAEQLSQAEISDLAAALHQALPQGSVRAALVVSTPTELARRLQILRAQLLAPPAERLQVAEGVFLGRGNRPPKFVFLFPGQGSPVYLTGGMWRRRFDTVRELYASIATRTDGEARSTAIAQPMIATASIAGLRMLDRLGIRAAVAVGHSLGELTAFHWAGALHEASLLHITAVRGDLMATMAAPGGAMASIAAGAEEVARFVGNRTVVIAALNSPAQTVISGPSDAVAHVVSTAQAEGVRAVLLPISYAFHSPLMEPAAAPLLRALDEEEFRPLRRTVVSTITGEALPPDKNLKTLLHRQMTSPVRFKDAIETLDGVDLFIEVGPGSVLSGLVKEMSTSPSFSLDAGGTSLKGLLQTCGVTFALGARIDVGVLFDGRLTRPLDLDWRPRFFVNPCELAPPPQDAESVEERVAKEENRSCGAAPIDPSASAIEVVRELVAQRAELPREMVRDDMRPLTDLHLNSITVSELITGAARRLGLPSPVRATEYADAKITEMAQALEELARTGLARAQEEERPTPPGLESWVQTFTVELIEQVRPHRSVSSSDGHWQIYAPRGHPLRERLQSVMASGDGCGIIACLPREISERDCILLLEAARTALDLRRGSRFVLVQDGGGGGALARTLFLEAPQVTTCVIDVPFEHPEAAEWVWAEALAAEGYSEIHYDRVGCRREPVLKVLPLPDEPGALPLCPDDVLLVTGGGKGIAAECALALARETGIRLGLLGRSQPASDPPLARNLERMAAMGVKLRYEVADVVEESAVHRAIRNIEGALGPVTAVMHGAGTNVPKLLRGLDARAFLQIFRPKVDGLRNVLAAIDASRLRLLVSFGSITARTGMRGEAHYALANEWLTRMTERFQADYPACRCVVMEWSLWSGIGMGERLGRVDALARQGITPITPEQGISLFRCLIAHPLPVTSVVVTGRFGEPPTVNLEPRRLPFWRFLEQPRVYYPHVELVADALLSADSDPYLRDHVVQGEQLFPAVFGLEAMAEAAMALAGSRTPPVFENVKFAHPIIVPAHSPTTLRVAALARARDLVEVVLRSETTGFHVDHFRALCRFKASGAGPGASSDPGRLTLTEVDVDPQRDLYGSILFHGPRFRRLQAYRALGATQCVAEIAGDGAAEWFSRYLPGDLVLGDPGARDAAIHAVQACIPHARILPVGVDRLILGDGEGAGARLTYAIEREQQGDVFTYDVEVRTMAGDVCEKWEGLRLRRIAGSMSRGTWLAPLLAPYAERRVQELIPGSVMRVVFEPSHSRDRRAETDKAIQRAVGKSVTVRRRPDGKPEILGRDELSVSAAHVAGLRLAVAGPGAVACDIEKVEDRPLSVWRELLGSDGYALAELVAREAREDKTVAATRIWAVVECLKKLGAMVDAPLTLASVTPDAWVVLASSRLKIATYAGIVGRALDRIVLALLVDTACERLRRSDRRPPGDRQLGSPAPLACGGPSR